MSRDREKEYVTLEDAEIAAETQAAMYVSYDGESHWIPKSLIGNREEAEGTPLGHLIDLEVEEWFAIKEEII